MSTISKATPASTRATPDVVSADEFKAVFRSYPAGVAVVTADDGTRRVAMTVSSVFSMSASPPILGFSASASSSSTRTLCDAETIVVHLLGAEHLELARLCATRGADRFDGTIEWSRLPTGEPFYPTVPTWIRGRITDRITAGASTLIVVEALEARSAPASQASSTVSPARPLVYHDRAWHALDEMSEISANDA